MPEPPILLVIGGPNGAGKSTIAPALVHDLFGLDEFVNADVIARGLSGFEPAHAAVRAGRIMLERLSELAEQRASFAFESTLASRSFAPRIERMIADGYQFNLAYVWVPGPEVSRSRVAARVRAGGHHVPDDEVTRRWAAPSPISSICTSPWHTGGGSMQIATGAARWKSPRRRTEPRLPCTMSPRGQRFYNEV